jgi:hypothetical protein
MADLLGGAIHARIDGRDDPAWSYVTKTRRGFTVAPSTHRQMIVTQGGTQ